jgi:hypothetical protein
MDEAKARDWTVISMKTIGSEIFPSNSCDTGIEQRRSATLWRLVTLVVIALAWPARRRTRTRMSRRAMSAVRSVRVLHASEAERLEEL